MLCFDYNLEMSAGLTSDTSITYLEDWHFPCLIVRIIVLNIVIDDKLPFKIIEKVQLLENVFRGESTLSCSLLPIVLAMPPRLTLLGHIFYYPNHNQGHTVGIQHRHSPLLWNAADQWRLLSAQPTLGTERRPANALLKPCSLMKELCWANICPLWI